MNYYNIIAEALERLIRWSEHKEFYSVSVSFKIEILDEYQDKDDIRIPHMTIHAVTNERNELIDLSLFLGLFFDGEDECRSKLVYDEIMSSRLGFLFVTGPVSQYNISASLGKDIKMASAVILYFVRLFSKSKDIEIKPMYYCPMILNGEMSYLKMEDGKEACLAIGNLMDSMFERTRTVGDSLLFDVLKDNRDDSEFLAEITVNKRHGGEGYMAWISTGEIRVQFLDAMFKRFIDYPYKYCAKEFNIQDNSLDVRVQFSEDQISNFIYFISDCLRISYPALNMEKIIAQFKYNYFSPVVQFYLNFYPDGKRPSGKELEYACLLRDNLEYDIDEEDLFDPEVR